MLCAGPLSSSQISLPCAGFLQLCAHTLLTDVTRIQEGVAAYYILRAHTAWVAWFV